MTRIRSIVTAVSRATGRIARLLGRLTTNAPGHTTVAAYLRAHGATDEWIARWGSAFGRRVAKNHRLATGTEPCTAWEITTKGLKRHMAYADLTHLDEAYAHYQTHPVAGPALPVTRPTTAQYIAQLRRIGTDATAVHTAITHLDAEPGSHPTEATAWAESLTALTDNALRYEMLLAELAVSGADGNPCVTWPMTGPGIAVERTDFRCPAAGTARREAHDAALRTWADRLTNVGFTHIRVDGYGVQAVGTPPALTAAATALNVIAPRRGLWESRASL